MSTTVYCQVLIYTAESTGTTVERTKMSNLRNGSKWGFEPGLTRLRVRHSTIELPRSTIFIINEQFHLAVKCLNLHSHDLRVPVGSLSRFKLCLPQCNVPGVLNCMSGRLGGFPSLYRRYLCISYDNNKYWQNAKVNPSSNTQQKVLGKFMLPSS